MPRRRREAAFPVGLAALAFALAVLQRPGRATSDTKIDLHVDPAGFLADVAAAWSPTADLGHVQGGQYGGYLLPMGPFFALGHLLGVAPWLVQRLWLGTVLAAGAWGAVRLMDALHGRPRGVAHGVAGLVMILNPYVVVFSARTSVTLLGLAALPWMVLAAHRGLRAPRAWWWPGALAVAVTLTGGGVNAAVTAWALLAPVLLVLYEGWTGAARWRDAGAFAWRAALACALASVWWVVPVLVQARHGVDFLRFTEQPGTIWSTTSLSESLRLMGYWISYLGVGYGGRLRPYFGGGSTMLFFVPLVVAGLLVPGLALGGFALTRRWRYGPFFLLLALAGLVIMTAGFPEGTPLRRALNFTYGHLSPVQFLRTTYKAGPLLAVAVACLAGAGTAALGRRLARPAAAVVAALAAVASWPLVTGRALDPQLTWEGIPVAWRSAAAHVDATVGTERRAVVLPGQLYAHYRWGATIDPILPVLARRPVAVRNAVPYADLRAVDLLWTADALVQQRRALPGQLGPLLDLMSAGTVVSGADDDRTRSGAAPAAEAADVLDQLGRPAAGWGRVRPAARAAGTLGPPRRLPQVRAWDRGSARPLVRVEGDGLTVVDGSAAGVAALAAFGALPSHERLAYAADVGADELRSAREVVITDSNRRRVFVVSRMAQNAGPTLAADEPFSPDAAVLDPFPDAGPAAQTVARYDGVAYLRAPASPGFSQFPERRPFAAVDGDPRTHWQADRALVKERHWIEVGFAQPRDVDAIDLLPYSDRRGRLTAVEVGGRRFAVRAGWNHLALGLRSVRSLRVRIAGVAHPPGVTGGPGGIRELRIPGVRVSEALRPPVLAERALRGHDVSATGLTYLFERTTGDDPFRRDPRHGSAGAGLVRDRADAERGLERLISPPAARAWRADGWATVAADAPDSALDRLVGRAGGRPGAVAGGRRPGAGAVFDSSGRFEGRPGFRASSAFDGTARPWIGSWLDGRTAWLQWSSPRPARIAALRLVAPRQVVRRPTLVRLAWDGGATPPLGVSPDGGVVLPRAVRARRFRLEILRAAFPPGTPGAVRQRRAVGIAEVRGAGVPHAAVPASGRVSGRCGDLSGRLGHAAIRLRLDATIADLDAGRPLRLRPCGPPVAPAGGPARLSVPPATLAPYLLRLRSPAPRPRAVAAAVPGQVLDPGRPSRDARRGVRLALRAPAWLVLGEAYNDGWRASCDGRDLGGPRPLDGYAMGWRVPASCRRAEMAFAPDRLVRAGYAVSAVVLVLLLAMLALRRPPPAAAPPPRVADHGVPVVPARRAAVMALAAGAVLGFVFAARVAPPIALATYVVLRRGTGARALASAAGALLVVVVPVLTLAIPVRNRGGYNPEYAQSRIAVHWVAVAAVVLLILALARELGAARRRRSPARRPPLPPVTAPARGPRPRSQWRSRGAATP